MGFQKWTTVMKFDFLSLLPLFLCLISIIWAFRLFLSKKQLVEDNEKLKEKKLTLESSVLSLRHDLTKSESRKSEHVSVNTDSQKLKREIAELKSEVKKVRQQKLDDSSSLKGEYQKLKTDHEILKKDFQDLLNQHREIEGKVSAQDPQLVKENKDLKQQQKDLRYKILELERHVKTEGEKVRVSYERIRKLEEESKEWEALQNTMSGAQRKLKPADFLKWYQRAMEGKKFYNLMKQMREMSDEKLQSYHQGIELLSKWVLRSLEVPLPHVKAGEISADRFLAAAWDAVLEGEGVSAQKDRNTVTHSGDDENMMDDSFQERV